MTVTREQLEIQRAQLEKDLLKSTQRRARTQADRDRLADQLEGPPAGIWVPNEAEGVRTRPKEEIEKSIEGLDQLLAAEDHAQETKRESLANAEALFGAMGEADLVETTWDGKPVE